MLLGDSMTFLCISLNNSSVDTVHLIDADLIDIDKYTVNYKNAKEIIDEFPNKIDELIEIYNLDNIDSNIKVRIFLPNDKEQFVMYKKHLVAFKMIIKDREFLRYVAENNVFSNKKIKDLILDDETSEQELFYKIRNYLAEMDENEFYSIVRKIVEEYLIYFEEYEDVLSIDELYETYIERLKEAKLEKTSELLNVNKISNKKNAFAVFDHPNFNKVYGQAINPGKPIFVLGSKMGENSKSEYKEIYENCKKCFSNPVYYPLNADVSSPMNDEFLDVYDDSLLVIVNGNGVDKELLKKIKYALVKNILVLILVNDNRNKEIFIKYFGNNENLIIKDYLFKDFESKKAFADIMAGFYINKYKLLKQRVGK